MAATIIYNGKTTEVEAGKTATLSCGGKKARTVITVNFGTAGAITYNGSTTQVEAGKIATLQCAGKKMIGDVFVAVEREIDELAGTWVIKSNNTNLAENITFSVKGVATFVDPSSSSSALATYQDTFSTFEFSTKNTSSKKLYADSTSAYNRYRGDSMVTVKVSGGTYAISNNVDLITLLCTITITSKLTEVPNGDKLLTWLKANAKKQ